MSTPRPFHEVLTDARPRSITQVQAARVCGVSRAALSSWERGLSTPSARSLARLLDYYAIPAEVRLVVYDTARLAI